jgi:hypothetical protein
MMSMKIRADAPAVAPSENRVQKRHTEVAHSRMRSWTSFPRRHEKLALITKKYVHKNWSTPFGRLHSPLIRPE